MKFRCLCEPQEITVEADTEFEAQNIAFGLIIIKLKPQHVTVWEAKPGDVWSEETAA